MEQNQLLPNQIKRRTRKQHYVPQFYLRQWCDEDNGFYPIKIEGKEPPILKIFEAKSNPSRFCYENFFYAQHTGKEDEISQKVEEKFAEIEGVFSTELPKIEKKILDNEQITEGDKFNLSSCMLFLHFKGKKYREESKKMTDHLIKQINKHIARNMGRSDKSKKEMEELGITKEQMIEYADKEEYTVDMGNTHHMEIMKEIQGFSNLLTAKYWKIYISRKGDFITTDTPYQDIALSKKFYGNDFLSREQTFILSPRVVIVARYPHKESGKKVNRKDITNNKGAIHTINTYNLMRSLNFGFHKNRDLLIELKKTTEFLYTYDKLNPKANSTN
ncbi:MAG: DUF4238 domain-containing protein [Candidatus Paceibacterota bacterium]|jgi:hypothetical protein